jgi:two-component system cell cycle sensor histidine kinase/response regulator CckA
MHDQSKTREQLLEELVELRRRNAALERSAVALQQAEAALRESENRYRNIFENAMEGIFQATADGRYLSVNPAFARMCGFGSPEEMIDGVTDIARQLYLDARDRCHIAWRYENRGVVRGFETRLQRKDGGVIWGSITARSVRDESGDVLCYDGIVEDITERKRAEEAVRESEERYRQLFEMESDAIFLVDDGTGAVLEVNASASELYGYSREEMLRIKNTDLSAEPEDTAAATRQRRSRVPIRYHRKKDGTVFPVEITARHFNRHGREVHVAAIRDISFRMEVEEEKRRLQAQLLQAQKMEAIGTLAGGLAHDFNNLLQAVRGYAELVLLRQREDEPRVRELHEIVRAAKRGADLTRQLLTFSRKVESKLQPMELNRRVEEVKELLARTIPKMIEIELRLADDVKMINADSTQIEQVLMNLAVNAKDAMPEGGRLFIETRNVRLDKGYSDTYLGARPGEYVLLMVSDTGYGMDQETLEHIFEPFFTTKGVGRGTGPGLAMVYGIVKSHNGYITCYSEVGHGTTFKIYLPSAESIPEMPGRGEESLPEGGTETVLLVDDEEPVRQLGKEMLETVGYRVLVASDGEEAMGLYTRRMKDIQLVILDLIMPGMGGKSCLEGLLRLDPRVKVLVASGYSVNGRLEEIVRSGACGFISKPYDLRDLLKRVRDVLDGDRKGP